MRRKLFFYVYSNDPRSDEIGTTDNVSIFKTKTVEGRRFKVVAKIIRPKTATETAAITAQFPLEVLSNEATYGYSNLPMTEKGYIYSGAEYELDNQGRLTYLKYLSDVSWAGGEDGYFEYIDGKKYRANDNYYTYTDSSYTVFSYQASSNPDAMSMWQDQTYVFDERGNIKKETYMFSPHGLKWQISQEWHYTNVYSNESADPNTYSGDDEVSNINVYATNTTVYAHAGTIHIFTENAATVQVFDIAGRLIKQQAASQGENRISVSSGNFYIVKVGNQSFKVSVR